MADDSSSNFSAASSPSKTSLDEGSSSLEGMREDIKICNHAMDLFLDGRFDDAQSILINTGKSKLYPSMAMSVLLSMKSLFTLDQDDVDLALNSIDSTHKLSIKVKRNLSSTTLSTRLSRILKNSNNNPTTKNSSKEDEIEIIMKHVELVTAEIYFLRAMLLTAVDTSGTWLPLIRESLHIRRAFWIYHNAFTLLATTTTNNNTDDNVTQDLDYESGILLGNGVVNLLFSLLPPKVLSVFAFLGYTGSISIGLAQLSAAIACKGGSRTPIAELTLLFYSTVLFNNKRRDESQVLIKEILDRRLSRYPDSPFFLYLQARFLIIRGEIPQANIFLERALQLKQECHLSKRWPPLYHACVWELLATSMYALQWNKCYELSHLLSLESKWSPAFTTFLEATFLASSQYTPDPNPNTRERIFTLLESVPKLYKKNSFYVEKYAVHRAREAIRTGEMPFLPEYELLLAWDGFNCMSREALDKVLMDINDIETGGGLRVEQEALILLIRTTIHCQNNLLNEALETLKRIIPLLPDLPQDSFIHVACHLEWAQVSLYLKDLSSAKSHYDLSTSYDHKYLLQRSFEFRQAKIKYDLDRLSL